MCLTTSFKQVLHFRKCRSSLFVPQLHEQNIFRGTIFRKLSVSRRYLIAYPSECHSGPRGHFGGRRVPPSTGSVADGTLAKSRIHPRAFEMGARQSGCKFDWRHRLRRILLFPKTEGGRERHGGEGLVSSSSFSWRKDASGSAAYIELEPFEYRHAPVGRGPPGCQRYRRIKSWNPTFLARLQLSLYDYPRTSYHANVSSLFLFLSHSRRKGIGAALPREPSFLAAILRPMH